MDLLRRAGPADASGLYGKGGSASTCVQQEPELPPPTDGGVTGNEPPRKTACRILPGRFGGCGQGGCVHECNGKTWLVTGNWNDLNADTPHAPHREVGAVEPAGGTA
ncbi:hypothetical protein [Actinoplanes sp. HUAS TT8]|uniref:hypothetical protein n=1 Tax=Actinoplanes sp. HUAS TT8 TaxID=3447453 RepID=UPI003F52232D